MSLLYGKELSTWVVKTAVEVPLRVGGIVGLGVVGKFVGAVVGIVVGADGAIVGLTVGAEGVAVGDMVGSALAIVGFLVGISAVG